MRVLRWSWLMVMLVAATAAADEPKFRRVDLVADPMSNVKAQLKDANLVNAWGLAHGPTTPWWVANNGTGTATLYGIESNGDVQKNPLVVSVDDTPTGQVFNGGDEFVVWDGVGHTAPARFLFATEDGTVWAWSKDVPPLTQAHLVFSGKNDDVYKGLALATDHHGRSHLYITDFRNARVIVLDGDFNEVDLGKHAFVDHAIPCGFAPFGIAAFGHRIFVTYAKQDDARHDDVAGRGNGFVDEYDLEGHLVRRVASRGALTSPWGLALGPESFGRFDDALLVGNFGDGHIHAYKQAPWGSFFFEGTLHDRHDHPLHIDGLWSIMPGNDSLAGSSQDLYFTAGPNGESDGLFGRIERIRW